MNIPAIIIALSIDRQMIQNLKNLIPNKQATRRKDSQSQYQLDQPILQPEEQKHNLQKPDQTNIYQLDKKRQLKFEVDYCLKKQIRQNLQIKCRQFVENDKLEIGVDKVREIKGLFSQLKNAKLDYESIQQDFQKQYEYNQVLQRQLESQKNNELINESIYVNKIQELKNQKQEQQDQLEQLKLQNQQLVKQIQKVEDQRQQEKEGLELKVQQINQKQKELYDEIGKLKNQNQKLQSSLDDIKEIRKVIGKEEIDFDGQNVDLKFYCLVGRSQLRIKVFEYLGIHDKLKLKLLNKQYYTVLNQDNRFLCSMIGQIKNQFEKERDQMKDQLNYFDQKMNCIPEEYLRQGLLKYIILKMSYGDFMKQVLQNCQILISGDPTDIVNKLVVEDVEFDIQNYQKIFQDQQQEKVGVIDRLKQSFKKSSQKMEEQNILEKQKIVSDFTDLINSINSNFQFVYSLKDVSFQQQSLQNIFKQSNSQVQLIFGSILNQLQKIGDDENLLSFYYNNLCKIFSQLFVYSNILHQEGKQLEKLKDYFVGNVHEKNQTIKKLINENDIINERNKSLSVTVDFLIQNDKDRRLQQHELDKFKIQNVKTLESQQSQIDDLKTENHKLQEQITQKDTKMGVLVQEIKVLRNKNNEQNQKIQNWLKNFQYIAEVFNNFNVD